MSVMVRAIRSVFILYKAIIIINSGMSLGIIFMAHSYHGDFLVQTLMLLFWSKIILYSLLFWADKSFDKGRIILLRNIGVSPWMAYSIVVLIDLSFIVLINFLTKL